VPELPAAKIPAAHYQNQHRMSFQKPLFSYNNRKKSLVVKVEKPEEDAKTGTICPEVLQQAAMSVVPL